MDVITKTQDPGFWDGLVTAIAVFSGLTTILLGIIAWLIARYIASVDRKLGENEKNIALVKEDSGKALSWIHITEAHEQARHELEAQRTRDLQQMRGEMHELNKTLINMGFSIISQK